MIHLVFTLLPVGTEVWGICVNGSTMSPWQPCTFLHRPQSQDLTAADPSLDRMLCDLLEYEIMRRS